MCKACEIIVSEIGLFRSVLKDTNFVHSATSVCSSMGYKHQPGSWFQDTCNEFIDDHQGVPYFNNFAILTPFCPEILKFYMGSITNELWDEGVPSDIAKDVCGKLPIGCPQQDDQVREIVEDEL